MQWSVMFPTGLWYDRNDDSPMTLREIMKLGKPGILIGDDQCMFQCCILSIQTLATQWRSEFDLRQSTKISLHRRVHNRNHPASSKGYSGAYTTKHAVLSRLTLPWAEVKNTWNFASISFMSSWLVILKAEWLQPSAAESRKPFPPAFYKGSCYSP